MSTLLLGIDGGGTHCRARISTSDGTILGEGEAGPANTRLGLALVFDEIEQATQQALHAAGLAPDTIHQLRAGLGLAGLNLYSEREKTRAYPHPFASIALASDAVIACLGAHSGQDGAVLILGTGSCGCAIVGGKPIMVGGWGLQLSDHASGAALGQAALRRSLLALERVIPATPLSRALMARFLDSPEQAVLWSNTAVPRDYAALAPLVFEYAAQDDPLALALLQETASDATLLIEALRQRGAPNIALLGGLAEPLRPYLPKAIQSVLSTPQGDALDGALLLARQD
ncbi:MAG: BadF/BadG/BcrA/BcrD ATPase family protein [Gammaproteobacteria bacterium]